MKFLVTGFVPFNHSSVNPSEQIITKLTAPANCELSVRVLPVEFQAIRTDLPKLLEKEKPDIAICLGQAGNRPGITPEYVAVNLHSTRSSDGKTLITDNAGVSVEDLPILPDAPTAYFTTLPVRRLVSAIQESGNPASLSFTAGTYLCNFSMYLLLHEAALHYPNMKAGFIHVPFLPEQLTGRDPAKSPVYAMELEDMISSIQAVLDDLALDQK